MEFDNYKIALVHDWYLSSSIGGAEKVTFKIDELLSENFSTPDLFAITENITKHKINFFKGRKINTSFIQKIPLAKDKIQRFLPLIPFAIEQIDFRDYDLIISSSHLSAKGILTCPDQLHISYIHTPMRYAWDQMNTYVNKSNFKKLGLEIPLRYLLFKLRGWDFVSGHRPDLLIANSKFTARRIKKYWGLESKVIHPPVDIKRFKFNQERESFYLSVNRLVPNKRIDLLIKAFNKLQLPLVIVGDGPERKNLEKMANKNIIFKYKSSNNDIEKLMGACRGFVYAGVEDFGIAPVEALASGAPVIALAKGGLLDTVNCINNCPTGKIATGLLFKKQCINEIVDAINWFEDNQIWKKYNSEDLNIFAQQFSTDNFKTNMGMFINKSLENYS